MKRFILYTFTLLFSVAVFGQNATNTIKSGLGPKPLSKITNEVDLTNTEVFYEKPLVVNGHAGASSTTTGGSRALTSIPLGSAGNIYTVLIEACNHVSYVPEINTVTFTHRSDPTYGASNVSFDHSTDGGATWTINTLATPDYFNGDYAGVVSGNRYPNGAIYNPTDNTNPDNAHLVQIGVAHDPTSGLAAWGWQYQGTSRLDGSDITEAYIQWDGISQEYIPAGLNTTSDGAYAISPIINNTNDVAYDYINFTTMRLVGALYNSITDDFFWGYSNWNPDVYVYTDPTDGSTQNYVGFDWNIAFGPDELTGYAVLIGAESTDAIVYPRPIVIKTTDGGATWTDLPDYNFYENLDLQEVILATPTGETLPYISAMDMVVDADGRLHLFCETYSKSTANNSADSLFFISGFDDGSGGFLQYTCMLHMTTTDGTDWTVHNVDNIIQGLYTLPGAGLTYNFRPNIGRTADGSKVFMTWSRSDTTLTLVNDLPDTWAIGYDVTAQEYTPAKNLTTGTDWAFLSLYPTLSPTVIEGGSDFDYELPLVVCELPETTESETFFHYFKGIGFNEDEFGGVAAPTANYTFSTAACTAIFTNTSSGEITSYSWDFGDTESSSAISPTHTYAADGTYNVCLTATGPGGSSTSCKDVTISECDVAINDIALSEAVLIYPSPSNGTVTVELTDNTYSNATVEVMNMLGETAHKAVNLSGKLLLNLGSLAEGNYMVKVTAENGGITTRQITIAK